MVRSSLSADEHARLDTWMMEIADAELGHAKTSGNGFRAGHSSGLAIHSNGTFHDFRNGGHGRGGLALLCHLRELDHGQGVIAAREWLSEHIGHGKLRPSSDDADSQADNDTQRQAYIETVWNGALPLAPGQAAMTYLNDSRALVIAPTDIGTMRWIENDRGEEGALVIADTDNDGKLVAIQSTFVTKTGQKTPLTPSRITQRGPHDSGTTRPGPLRR